MANGASPASSTILQLQNASGIPICDLTLTSTGVGVVAPGGNLYQATALYQNAQSCVAVLNQAASLSSVTNATAGFAVCVSNLTMLPSQVLDSGDQPSCFVVKPTEFVTTALTVRMIPYIILTLQLSQSQ